MQLSQFNAKGFKFKLVLMNYLIILLPLTWVVEFSWLSFYITDKQLNLIITDN